MSTVFTLRARPVPLLLMSSVLLALAGCADKAMLPPVASTGPAPALPQPVKSLIPTVDIAPAKGWPAGVTPRAASGFAVAAFATGLTHPRWLYVLPNGDVLVAESNSPPKPKARASRAG